MTEGHHTRAAGMGGRGPRVRWGRRACLLALLVLAGCAASHQPDLTLLYQDWAAQKAGRPALVGIPGLMGSEIVQPTSGEVFWGRLSGLFKGSADMRLALPLTEGSGPSLEPTTSIRQVGGMDVYAGIMDTLTGTGGYTLATLSSPAPPAPLYEFAYDWRLGCEDNAARLAAFVASVRRSQGDPRIKVDLVAHSMGGLIARYFILYGGCNVLDSPGPAPTDEGAPAVRKLVMLGTPNSGSARAVLALLRGRRVGLARIPPDLLATMPAMAELMPPPDVPVLFAADGRPAQLDLYDPETWRKQGWGIFDPAGADGIRERYRQAHPGATEKEARAYVPALQARFGVLLRRAAAFHRALDARPLPASVHTLLLGGDCTPTLRGLVVELEGGHWVVRASPGDVRRPVKGVDLNRLYYGPGDGDVTKSSLLAEVRAGGRTGVGTCLPHALSGFICEKHADLVKSITFRDNLLHFLLYAPISPPRTRGQRPPNPSSPEQHRHSGERSAAPPPRHSGPLLSKIIG